MESNSRGWLFRKRNVLGVALVAGIIVGTYLPNFWGGFGGGSIVGVGLGDPKSGSTGTETGGEADQAADSTSTENTSEEIITQPLKDVPPVVKVMIDERSYYLRSSEGDRPVETADVIALVKAASGDADGIRVRIYRRKTSRIKAEQDLQDALVAAGIKDTAILWIPVPID